MFAIQQEKFLDDFEMPEEIDIIEDDDQIRQKDLLPTLKKREYKWPYSDNRRIYNHIINKIISELKVTIIKVKYYFII